MDTVRDAMAQATEWMVHRLLFWEADDARKGRILRAYHHALAYGFITILVVSHTLYRRFWLQTLVLICMLFIWVHHLLVGDCILTCVEQNLTGDITCFWAPYIELAGMTPTPEVSRAVLLTASTTCFGLLTLEWISNVLWAISQVL